MSNPAPPNQQLSVPTTTATADIVDLHDTEVPKFSPTRDSPVIFPVGPNPKGNFITAIAVDEDRGMIVVGQTSGAVRAWRLPLSTDTPIDLTNRYNRFECVNLCVVGKAAVQHLYIDRETGRIYALIGVQYLRVWDSYSSGGGDEVTTRAGKMFGTRVPRRGERYYFVCDGRTTSIYFTRVAYCGRIVIQPHHHQHHEGEKVMMQDHSVDDRTHVIGGSGTRVVWLRRDEHGRQIVEIRDNTSFDIEYRIQFDRTKKDYWGFQFGQNENDASAKPKLAYVSNNNVIKVIDLNRATHMAPTRTTMNHRARTSSTRHDDDSSSDDVEEKMDTFAGPGITLIASNRPDYPLLYRLRGHSGYILAFEFCRDTIVSLGSDRKICVWRDGEIVGQAVNVPGTFVPGYPYILKMFNSHQVVYSADDGIFMVDF